MDITLVKSLKEELENSDAAMALNNIYEKETVDEIIDNILNIQKTSSKEDFKLFATTLIAAAVGDNEAKENISPVFLNQDKTANVGLLIAGAILFGLALSYMK